MKESHITNIYRHDLQLRYDALIKIYVCLKCNELFVYDDGTEQLFAWTGKFRGPTAYDKNVEFFDIEQAAKTERFECEEIYSQYS